MEYIDDFLYNLQWLSDNQISRRFLYLGEGIARKVYAVNDKYVVKIAKGIDGYFQNNVENFIYNNAEKYLLQYLCPIIAFTPRIVIMKRAKPLSPQVSRKINISSLIKDKNAPRDINFLVNKYYLYYNDIFSSKSWGKLDGNYVLIDYGCTDEKGDYFYRNIFGF